jgi:alpha-tubulin suppressor-like RCC1 family protein
MKVLNCGWKVLNISCGWQHALIVTVEGLFGIGCNRFHQLGLEGSTYSTPTLIPTMDVRKAWAGFRSSIMLSGDGTLRGSGSNKFGELGGEGKVYNQFIELPLPT